MQQRLYKATTVELLVQGIPGGSTQQTIKFDPQPYLTGRSSWAIETFTEDDVTLTPLGWSLPSVAQLEQAYLTLYFFDEHGNSGEYIKNIPLVQLHRVQNGTDPFVKELTLLTGQRIQWEQSYVTLSAAFGNTTNISFLFSVQYDDPEHQRRNSLNN